MPKKPEEDNDSVSDIVSDDPEEAEEDEEASNDLTNADIVTKYRTAGTIANEVLAAVVAAVQVGGKVVELCELGDRLVEEACSKIYNTKKGGKKVEKGTAFPTCVSLNNCVGHYSPLVSEDKMVVAEGDVVKIDLGVHVDGYIAVVAHTVLAQTGPATGRKADVMQAAWQAAECAQRMLKDGCTNAEITEMIATVAESYNVNPVEGVLSHQMKKHVIDANKVRRSSRSAEARDGSCRAGPGWSRGVPGWSRLVQRVGGGRAQRCGGGGDVVGRRGRQDEEAWQGEK